MESNNINEIVGYFKSGYKNNSKNYIGLELEHFIMDKATGKNFRSV